MNNAGWSKTGVPLMQVDDQQFVHAPSKSTPCRPSGSCSSASLSLIARGGGSIINFGSGAGTQGLPGEGPYAAAKEAIRGLTRVAANEWGPEGIRVNVICPFANSPGMVAWSKMDPKGYEATIGRIPLRRAGDCEMDIGGVAVFLASDESAYVTGQTMMVDGGMGSFR